MVRPKKQLGQHFLTDPSIAKRITDALQSGSSQTVLEVGPGKGILTRLILERGFRRFIPVEIDRESTAFLLRQWPELSDELVSQDFLTLDLHRFGEPSLAVIGNFPYNISGPIFFHILKHRDMVHEVVGMVQREVAERIAAPPGSRTYGILSVLLQAYYDSAILFRVKPGSFFPPPKVTSAVLHLTRNRTDTLACNEELFFRVVKTTFQQRRKTIRNSLRTILLTLSDDFRLLSMRPEQLSVSEFVELTNWVDRQRETG